MSQRRFWLSTQVDEDIFTELTHRATHLGMRKDALIARYILEGLKKDVEEDETPLASSEVFLAVQKMQEKQRTEIHLQNLAADAETEEDYDNLERLCKIANVSVESTLEKARKLKDLDLPVYSDSTGARAAMAWLQELIPPGKRVAANDVVDAGKQRNFTKPTLEEAKRKLGIRSVRDSNKWYWVRPE